MTFTDMETRILPFVEKPARYIGGEFNSIVKTGTSLTRVALIYPDMYEIGMSNIALKILYNTLNSHKDFACERAFAVWGDMEKALRDNNIPLYSLETKTPLKDFDILGFSFQYELLYTNFLNILDLSGIPFYSRDRDETCPFIIAGGPSSSNLEPVADFLDAICVGDGESRIIEMSQTIRYAKTSKFSRQETLQALAEIDGVYVPQLYETEINGGFIIPKGRIVNRFNETDLTVLDFPVKQIIPSVKAVQDRSTIEVARGCARGCRFCQAGFCYRPVRERTVNQILELARNSIQATGYREFSLISLSISDYSNLSSLITALDGQFSSHGISFSLPSLRLDSFTLELADKVSQIRKSGLTFAVEGGTQGIRDTINKGVNEDSLFNVVEIARGLGWRSVKLYFMVGLPFTDIQTEIDGITELVSRLSSRFRDISVTVSVAIFVPKPHTPFQWAKQLPFDKALQGFRLLKDRFRKNRRVSIKYNDPFISTIEGVFSRGDRQLSRAIETAFKQGARFDGWSEMFNFNLWQDCFNKLGTDTSLYLNGTTPSNPLPWQVINNGVSTEFLREEEIRAKSGILTPSCDTKCEQCGVCDFKTVAPKLNSKDTQEPQIKDDFLFNIKIERTEEISYIRFLYSKTGSASFLNQIDIEEALSRGLIRANIPVKFTKGFNPHIRVEMGWALPVGFESEYELSQLELNAPINKKDFIERYNDSLREGLRILDAVNLDAGHKLNRATKSQRVNFSFIAEQSKEELLTRYKQNMEFKKITPRKEKIINLDEFVGNIYFENGRVFVEYFQTDGGARIQDIISAITGKDTREAVALKPFVHLRYIKDNDTKIPALFA